jgi:hypothetical protein
MYVYVATDGHVCWTQQTSITVYRLPTKEKQTYVCGKKSRRNSYDSTGLLRYIRRVIYRSTVHCT